MMERIKNHLTFFMVVQFFVLLLAVGVYAQHDSKPTGWWQFDEGAGSFVGDASGNGNNARVTGANGSGMNTAARLSSMGRTIVSGVMSKRIA